jgi:putative methionine-R-sulfoxide reductase with GAF domain
MTTLRVLEGPEKGKSFALEGDIIFLGRGAKSGIRIADHTVSRMHLKMFRIGTALFVEDLKSSNGTLINGTALEPGEGRQVDGEDLIKIGDTVIRIEDVILPKDLDFEELSPGPSQEASVEGPGPVERRSRSFRETEVLSNISELLRGPITLAETLERLSEQLLDVLPRIDRAAVFLQDKETGDVKPRAMRAKSDSLSAPFSLDAVKEAFDEGKTVTVADMKSRLAADAVNDEETMEVKSLLCVPMSAHGSVFGVLYLDGVEGPYAYRKEDLLWSETLCTLIAYAIENTELASRLSVIADLASSKQE